MDEADPDLSGNRSQTSTSTAAAVKDDKPVVPWNMPSFSAGMGFSPGPKSAYPTPGEPQAPRSTLNSGRGVDNRLKAGYVMVDEYVKGTNRQRNRRRRYSQRFKTALPMIRREATTSSEHPAFTSASWRTDSSESPATSTAGLRESDWICEEGCDGGEIDDIQRSE